MLSRAAALALLLAPAAGLPQEAGLPPAPTPAPSAVDAAPGAPVASSKGFALQVGWGYYEVTHLGASYRFDERAALSLFGGYGLAGGATTVTGGISFAHALFQPFWTLQPGWDVKAIYWTRSDGNYDWKALSLVGGLYLAKDLGPRLRLALDAGAAWTGVLQSDRKQDYNFGFPERWNGSVCLEISYRLGGP